IHWLAKQNWFKTHQDLSGLHSMACRTNPEVMTGNRNAQILKKYIIHLEIIVLPRMNDLMEYFSISPIRNGLAHRSQLDELRPRAHNGYQSDCADDLEDDLAAVETRSY